MSDRKMSWLKFWPDDYLNSERVKLMSISQEWAYFTLILRSARDGSVPASPEECVRLLGKGVKSKDVAVALEVFVPVEGQAGRVAHPRVLRDRAEVHAKSEKNAEAANARWGKMRPSCGRNANASKTHSEGDANASEAHSESDANGMPRALAQEYKSTRVQEEESNTNLAHERDARSERAELGDNSAWIAREIASLPAAWSTGLREKWAEWLSHLVEREQRKCPAKDPILCRPPTSTLDAHRRTLSPLPDDATRAAWLETAISARLGRPAEPTRPASSGARNTNAGGRPPSSTAADHEKGF